MSRLLSFNPEPFEGQSEFDAVRREYKPNEQDQWEEFTSNRRGSGSPSFHRAPSASVRTAGKTTFEAYKLAQKTLQSKGVMDPSSGKKSLSSSKGSPQGKGGSPARGGRFQPRFGRWYFGLPTYPLVEALAADTGPALRSEHVQWLQNCLNQYLGLQLPVDGIINASTRSAIRSFQERSGLPVDGLAGPPTEAALKAVCNATAPDPYAPDVSAGESPAVPQTEWEYNPLTRPRWRPIQNPPR